MATYPRLTILYALPRSMTQWWAWFMAQGPCVSMHDPLARCRSPRDLTRFVDAERRTFIADTSAIYFHGSMHRIFPGHRALYMLRDPTACLHSAMRQGGNFDLNEATRRLMHHASRAPDHVVFRYGELDAARVALLYRDVTGRGVSIDSVRYALRQKVDVPLRRQYRNTANTLSLFQHKDPI